MDEISPRDVELVKLLIPHWHATRRWAEELLCRSLQLKEAKDVLSSPNRGRKRIEGSTWFYRTHGIGVDIFKGLGTGGIDFDFDKPEPDPWRLLVFAEKQLNAGNIPDDYLELVDNEERFKKAAECALGPRS